MAKTIRKARNWDVVGMIVASKHTSMRDRRQRKPKEEKFSWKKEDLSS
jgi:hypothetical protein